MRAGRGKKEIHITGEPFTRYRLLLHGVDRLEIDGAMRVYNRLLARRVGGGVGVRVKEGRVRGDG